VRALSVGAGVSSQQRLHKRRRSFNGHRKKLMMTLWRNAGRMGGTDFLHNGGAAQALTV
jgi:hypothetical protein